MILIDKYVTRTNYDSATICISRTKNAELPPLVRYVTADTTNCSFVARPVGMLHPNIAVCCRIDHIAAVDHSLCAVDIVALVETIGVLAGKYSHSE